jgi:hypothetical protein
MSGKSIVVFFATLVVVLGYFLFKSVFSGVEKATSKTSHIKKTNVLEKLDVRNKQSIIDGIDHYIDIGDYDEGLKLCKIYYDYNEYDEDIEKRIKYINKISF